MTAIRVARSRSTGSNLWLVGLLALLSAAPGILLSVGGDVARGFVWLLVVVVVARLTGLVWARGDRSGGLAPLLFGVVGLAVGLGVGLRWLQAGAATWEAMAAMVSLASGLALIGIGLQRATDRMMPLSRIAIGSLIVLAVAVLVWTVTPALVATNVPPTRHREIGLGTDGREVRFVTADGVRMWGWYVPPPNGRVVILRHGAGSTASDVLKPATVLVSNGYGVLMTDARGHGRSDGVGMDFGWYGTEDISAAVTFLTEQPEVDDAHIALLGMSMGGEEAIGAIGSDARIAAVVAEGATARSDSDKMWLVDEYGWRGWLQLRLEWLQYGLTDLLTEASKPPSLAAAARRASPRPILMITAGDMPDELHAAEHVAGSTDNLSIWTGPNAGHIQGAAVAPVDWEHRVLQFLDDALDNR